MKYALIILCCILFVPNSIIAIDYEELARYWAPVIFQDTDPEEDNPNGIFDYITNFDFDGDYNGSNNHENASDLNHPLRAYVYYDVRETETHFYITYAFFHPYDRPMITPDQLVDGKTNNTKSFADSHENDLEGVIYCIRKNGSMGLLRACITVAHFDLLPFYVHPDASITTRNEIMNDTDLYLDGHRPVIFIEQGGHGVGEIDKALESSVSGDITFNGEDYFRFHGGDGIIYRLADIGESPQIPSSENDRDVRYGLLPIKDMWNWQKVPPDGDTTFAQQRFDYSPNTGCNIKGLKKYFATDESDTSANPPWVWGNFLDLYVSDGDFFLDPALAFNNIYLRFDDTDIQGFHTYIRNDYFSWGISLKIVLPNSGVIWPAGDLKLISWNSQISDSTCGLKDSLVIELSRDRGITWNKIGKELVSAGQYYWTVEGPASQMCRIRLVARLNCDRDIPVYSEETGIFSIIENETTYYITADAGSHGEIDWSGDGQYPAGSTIIFTAIPNQDYEVEYWRLDGDIVQPGGNTYILSDIQNSHFITVTFRPVEITSIKVLAPNGSETWFRGRDSYISWEINGNCGDYVKIELLSEGNIDHIIVPSITTQFDYYKWNISNDQDIGCDYKIRVSSLSGDCSDVSDNTFCIQPPEQIDTIRIYSAADLQMVSTGGNYPRNGYYLLMDNIDARDCGNFDPIGSSYEYYFRGTFDGQGHTIHRLGIDRSNESYIGLFSVIMQNAVVKNLIIEDDGIYGFNSVGVLAGENAGTIVNCHVKIHYLRGTGTTTVGGLVGENTNYGVIQNCSVVDLVPGNGRVRSSGTSPDYIGGLVGVNSGIIEWCWTDIDAVDANYTDPDVKGYDVGGLVGTNYGTISECYSNCRSVDGYAYSGGIVGNQVAGSIVNCYSSGDNVKSHLHAGGIAGRLEGGSINNCYVNGHVQAEYSGALIGESYSNIANSFWNRDRTGIDQVTGNSGGTVTNCHSKVTSELKQQETFTTMHSTNWDFENVWSIADGTDFPRLRGAGNYLSSPTGLIASCNQSDGIHVAWNPVYYYVSDNLYEAVYKVFRSDSPSDDAIKTELSGWQHANVFIDETAIPGAKYFYYVKAAATIYGSRCSGFSGWVEGVRTIPPADAPSGVTATDSLINYILIEWNRVDNGSYYQVYRSESIDGVKTTLSDWQTGLSYCDQPDNPDSIYYYWVRAAKNNMGENASEYGGPDTGYYISSTVPTLLQAYDASFINDKVEISWTLSQINKDAKFYIYRIKVPERIVCECEQEVFSSDGVSYKYIDNEFDYGSVYKYRVDYSYEDKRMMLFETKSIIIPSLRLVLHQNYPNPFNPITKISFVIPKRDMVNLSIYDVEGKLVKVIVHRILARGKKEYIWDGKNMKGVTVNSGIYFCRLKVGQNALTKKMVLLR